MGERMEEYEVECGECGSPMNLYECQNHICEIQQPSTSKSLCLDSNTQQSSSEDNLIPRLIEAIQARPPLWDHTLPLKTRGRDVRERLWREIEAELGHILPIPALEKKWKNLKDTFLKHLKNFKPQSGAGVEDKKKWKYFDNMAFLSSINTPKRTLSNFVTTPMVSPSPLSNTVTPVDSEPEIAETPCSSRKIKKKNDDTDKLLLEVLKEPPPPQTQQPQLSPALLTIQSVLEKLPQRVRMRAEIDMLNKVYSLHEEYGDD